MERFLLRIQGKRVSREVEDRVLWAESKSRKFFVKSFYIALEPKGSTPFPMSSIWRSYVPPKISFFAWEMSWGKTLILDQVKRRGWLLANKCFLFTTSKKNPFTTFFFMRNNNIVYWSKKKYKEGWEILQKVHKKKARTSNFKNPLTTF